MTTHDEQTWTSPSELQRYAADDELWSQYADTGVHVAGIGTIVPDLSGGVSGTSEAFEAFEAFEPMHIITAIQPGMPEQAQRQRARLKALDQFLAKAEIRAVTATGFALNAEYAEESRAVFGLSDTEARELGRHFGQVAVFRITATEFVLLACVGDRVDVRGTYFSGRVLSDAPSPTNGRLTDEEAQ